MIVDADSKWYLAAGGKKGPAGRDLPLVLAHGALANDLAAAAEPDARQAAMRTLTVTMAGSKISATVDGKIVATVTDTTHTHGMAAVGSGELAATVDPLHTTIQCQLF